MMRHLTLAFVFAAVLGLNDVPAKPAPLSIVCESAVDDIERTAQEQRADGYLVAVHTVCRVIGTDAPAIVRVVD